MTSALARLPVRTAGLIMAALVFAVDRLVKWWVMGPLHLPDLFQIEVVPIFRLTFTQNFGVSLGLLTAGSPGQRWALVALTGAIAVGVTLWLWRERRRIDALALGAVLGGALGNIWDRATGGFVIDYADLHFGEWRPFLIFNLADAAITIGVLIILARAVLFGEKAPQPAAPTEPAQISES